MNVIMKTKFNISSEIFEQGFSTLNECYDHYEENYKKEGYILDKEKEEVYKIFDKEIHLKEGDRVFLFFFGIVTWKCIDVEEGVIEYIIKEE